jgi:hypothetical protein
MRAPSHPPIDALRAFGDGEATAAEAGRTAAHLEGCTECRARLAGVRALREEIRQATTLSPPPGTWERIAARRAAGEELILPVADVAVPRRSAAPAGRHRIPLRRAAVLLLGMAGIASATVPGSPLREWLRGRGRAQAEAPGTPAPPVPVPDSGAASAAGPAPLPAGAPEAGIGVEPAGGEVRVTISRPGPALRIRVRLGEGPVAQVRGRGAAADAGYASGRGSIAVSDPRSGELEVVLPRAARRATLTVDGTRFVLLQDGQMTVLVPADSSGAELVFPGRP